VPSEHASLLTAAFAPGRPAFIAYLMGGYPDAGRSLAAMRAVAEAGADIIELGVPYADPLADGPVIQHAAKVARAAAPDGFALAETLDVAAEFTAQPDMPPVVIMTYFNPMLRLGLPAVAARARLAGVSGFIVPDLPPDSAAPWLAVSSGIDTVFLAAPTSTCARLELIGERSRGFVYCVSSLGVTGERSELPVELTGLVARVKAATPLPVAVGFGVSTPDQAAAVAAIADGVIVGSALVRRQDDLEALGVFVSEMAAAVHAR